MAVGAWGFVCLQMWQGKTVLMSKERGVHWGDWVAGAATRHATNLSPAAGGIYTVHINKHAQTYIWAVFSYIYIHIHIFQLSRVEVHYWHSILAPPPAQGGWYCLCSWVLCGGTCARCLANRVYMCIYCIQSKLSITHTCSTLLLKRPALRSD